jgi:hypothetical protein
MPIFPTPPREAGGSWSRNKWETLLKKYLKEKRAGGMAHVLEEQGLGFKL